MSATIVTGTSAAAWSERMARLTADRRGFSSGLYKRKNKFFGGESVTVTGLLVSKDVTEALAAESLGDAVLVPARCCERRGDLLDGGTVSGVSEKLNVPVLPFYVDGEDFLRPFFR